MVDLPDLPKIQKQTDFAPPPPPEIEVRTMKSDLDSISASGGISLQADEVASMITSQEEKNPPRKSGGGWLSLVLIGLVVLVTTGLVALLFFFIISGSTPDIGFLFSGQAVSEESEEGLEYEPVEEVYESVEYVSFLNLETQDIVPIVVPRRAASSASDLKTFRQRLLEALAGIQGRNALVEVVPQDEEELAYAWGEYLQLNDIDLLPSAVWQDVFEPSFNLFVYRDGRGSWPGYILKLRPDESPNTRRATVRAMESRLEEISKLFIKTPTGGRGFEDAVVINTATRQQQYESPIGATFVYGWYGGKYLVISTSFNGMEAVITLLEREAQGG